MSFSQHADFEIKSSSLKEVRNFCREIFQKNQELENEQEKLILVTKLGKGFISNAKQMITNQKKGKNIINLKNDDELLNVHQYNNTHLVLISKNEKIL